jgi:hypothetical protein
MSYLTRTRVILCSFVLLFGGFFLPIAAQASKPFSGYPSYDISPMVVCGAAMNATISGERTFNGQNPNSPSDGTIKVALTLTVSNPTNGKSVENTNIANIKGYQYSDRGDGVFEYGYAVEDNFIVVDVGKSIVAQNVGSIVLFNEVNFGNPKDGKDDVFVSESFGAFVDALPEDPAFCSEFLKYMVG